MTTDHVIREHNNRAREMTQTMSIGGTTTGLGQRQHTMSTLTITTGL